MKIGKFSFRRFLALLLAVVFMMSNICVTAYAESTTSNPDDEDSMIGEESLYDPENDAFYDFGILEEENAYPPDYEMEENDAYYDFGTLEEEYEDLYDNEIFDEEDEDLSDIEIFDEEAEEEVILFLNFFLLFD